MTEPRKLTGKQARYLRSLGHSLKPLLQVGKFGITDSFIHQAQQALQTHELIKVKVIKTSSEEPQDVANILVEKLSCSLAQFIGKTLLLYKPREENPTIKLPPAS